MSRHLVVVGDALLDRDLEGRVDRLCPEAPVPVVDAIATTARPGGAGLAAALAARDGGVVTLVTALARDAGGRELAELLAASGVEIVDVGLDGETPEKVRVRHDGKLLLRIDHAGRPGTVGELGDEGRRALRSADAVLVSDYGRGLTRERTVRAALAEAAARGALVWDPHPQGGEPVSRARLVTPNREEAAGLVPEIQGDALRDAGERACVLTRRWSADAVAVTLGANGAVLVERDGRRTVVAAPPVAGGDPCGAGDRFAATAARILGDGATVDEAVAEAVREASAFVAAGGAGSFQLEAAAGTVPKAERGHAADAVAARVRAAGGKVVATGGCFDLLHAGHVRTLEAARALGDCLIVLLNSDDSVRRLKGRDRPLVPEADRAAVLEALACVDAVLVFDEGTPEAVLDRLRPDVWAKGGDYDADDLPEAAAVAAWGGEVVILPYVEGRSTTRLLRELTLRGA